ncbi:MAG: LptF/LptG family permease [Gemmatimonadota bacterium]
MRTLTKYTLRQLVAPFMFAITALTLLMLLDQLAKRFGGLIGKGLGWRIIVEVFALSIPFIFAVIVPMAVLVAVLYTFNRMAADNEISAMKASGVSLFRLTVPVLLLAAMVALGLVWFNDTILPETNHKLQLLTRSIGRKSPTFALKERVVNEVVRRQLFLQALRIDQETSRLEDVTIWDVTRPPSMRTIFADSGTMQFNESQTDLYLTLYDGVVNETDGESDNEFQRTWFDVQFLRVPSIANELERQENERRGDREMSIDSLRARAHESLERADAAERTSRALAVAYTGQLLGNLVGADTLPPDSSAAAMTGWRSGGRLSSPTSAANTFRSQATQQDRHVKDAQKYEVEYWKKYSIPFACIVFVLIGVPIAVRYRQAGISMVVGASFLVFTAYYVALIGGENLADQRLLKPFWAMWSPNVLFLVIGIALFFRARRAGG